MRVTHEVLQGGQGDATAHHVCSKCVSKPVRIGKGDLAAQAMMAEQRAQSSLSQWLATPGTLQGNE
jgi:hypothetical protein